MISHQQGTATWRISIFRTPVSILRSLEAALAPRKAWGTCTYMMQVRAAQPQQMGAAHRQPRTRMGRPLQWLTAPPVRSLTQIQRTLSRVVDYSASLHAPEVFSMRARCNLDTTASRGDTVTSIFQQSHHISSY